MLKVWLWSDRHNQQGFFSAFFVSYKCAFCKSLLAFRFYIYLNLTSSLVDSYVQHFPELVKRSRALRSWKPRHVSHEHVETKNKAKTGPAFNLHYAQRRRILNRQTGTKSVLFSLLDGARQNKGVLTGLIKTLNCLSSYLEVICGEL